MEWFGANRNAVIVEISGLWSGSGQFWADQDVKRTSVACAEDRNAVNVKISGLWSDSGPFWADQDVKRTSVACAKLMEWFGAMLGRATGQL